MVLLIDTVFRTLQDSTELYAVVPLLYELQLYRGDGTRAPGSSTHSTDCVLWAVDVLPVIAS